MLTSWYLSWQIARSTLLRHHVRLFQFTACDTALAQHKEAYFNLLRMLKRIRGHFSDETLHGKFAARTVLFGTRSPTGRLPERIARLLLSLSTSMHIVLDADKRPNTACCPSQACHESLAPPARASPYPNPLDRAPGSRKRSPSLSMPRTCHNTLQRPTTQLTAPPPGWATAPDIQLTRARKRKLQSQSQSRGHTPESDEPAPPRGRRIRRCLDGHESHFYGHEDDEEPLSFAQKPMRRFGILFTLSKQYQRHGR